MNYTPVLYGKMNNIISKVKFHTLIIILDCGTSYYKVLGNNTQNHVTKIPILSNGAPNAVNFRQTIIQM